jgi:hypothetical protein
MTRPIQRDHQLLFYRNLGIVGIVKEDRVIFDVINNLIKGCWINPKNFSKLVKTFNFEDFENMGHLRWGLQYGFVTWLFISL